MFEEAWQTEDVYQEWQVQRKEAARARIMDPYLVQIIGLFQGQVIDKPEQDILETEYTSGGKVENKIFMIGGILLVITKFNLEISLEDNVAQLFVEILGWYPAAAKVNKTVDLEDQHIYGLLTDLIDFHFYCYDPLAKEFAFDETLVVGITRDVAYTDMIPVGNKIFSVILTAYIEGLEAMTLKSIEMKEKGDVSSSPGSASIQQTWAQKAPSKPVPLQPHTHGRWWASTNCCWEVALQLAQQCCDKFKEPVKTVDGIQKNSTAALELLAKSVWSIPRASSLTGAAGPSSTEEIKDLAHHMVHTKYLNMINDS
ncbi:uncharacterized protein LACBIDRAFT_307360 [Laccaria bicolor S238N-H82]|uniref:Predicted protein n=1 Tax=Laccaria bicolor (strain S238N-H82 / ATCC MYA-4686) TaxID=486041 RepID=B0DPY2_LACBS|nr:uncharacterized protein LACBIDRAFT_307360 [Laccaria bicolor S238N-H82]EDR03293.1 predicted protein [Laccaria bicolor S238N-H82]|eukprot:XP_001886089.1 predicted protein [Laccaria bicolor S238N-H82]